MSTAPNLKQNETSQGLFEWLQHTSNIGIWKYDLINNTLEWSDETYRIHEIEVGTQIAVEEAINFYKEGASRDLIAKSVNECIDKGTPFEGYVQLITAKGNQRDVRAIGRRISSESGVPTHIEGLFQDLTKINKANSKIESLTHALAEYSSALNETSILAKTDPRGQILEVNDLFCEISEYSREELLGQDHRILNSGFHPKSFFTDMWKHISQDKVWRGHIKNRKKHGDYYWVDTTIYPLHSKDGKLHSFLAIRTDITDLKEKQVADLNLVKFASVGESAAQTLHDVMNPLNNIQGTSTYLKRVETDDKGKEYLDKAKTMISTNIARIIKIFDGMRSMLLDEVDFEPVGLTQVLDRAKNSTISGLRSRQVDITFEETSIIFNQGNENLLIQVFTNLFKNSLDAIADLPSQWIKVTTDKGDRGHLIISVTDSGLGIPTDVQRHLFDPLYTTKKNKGGTGLGLALVKKVVELHKGTIKVNQDSDHTQIVMEFPAETIGRKSQ